MAVPTTYTEQSLAVFMASVIGDVAMEIPPAGWDVTDTTAGDYQNAVDETLIHYGVSDIVAATDIPKIRAIARWQVWQAVYDALAGTHDISGDGQNLQLSQVPANVEGRLSRALQAAAKYLPDYALTLTPIVRKDGYVVTGDASEWG